ITLPANFDPTLRSSYPTRSNSAANDTIVHTIETAYRLDGSYELGWGILKSLQFGGRYADLSSDYRDYQAKLGATNPNIATLPD
ncbi:hypothetical protein INQ10_24895, partial [Escherichia coli]|nr:hypothetical protein [Escherichia coli]